MHKSVFKEKKKNLKVCLWAQFNETEEKNEITLLVNEELILRKGEWENFILQRSYYYSS